MKNTPEKHANGIGHQEAVVQNAKERLIVALIYRGDAKKSHLEFYFISSFVIFFVI